MADPKKVSKKKKEPKVPEVKDLFDKDKDETLDVNNADDNNQDLTAQIVNGIYSTDNIQVKSEIAKVQLMPLTKLLIFGKHFSIPSAQEIAEQYLTLSISKDRKGRQEHVDVAKSAITTINNPFNHGEDEQQGLAERLILGRR